MGGIVGRPTRRRTGAISFDTARQRLVLQQFHTEGFVNQFVHDPAQAAKVVFTTEAIDNIPAGWRARENVCSARHR
jgi:hypothetical protein